MDRHPFGNARVAIPKGHELDVSFSRPHVVPDAVACCLDEARLLGSELPPGDCVCLTVSDNGTGTMQQAPEHLFEPASRPRMWTRERRRGRPR